jgi:hypothetical protein
MDPIDDVLAGDHHVRLDCGIKVVPFQARLARSDFADTNLFDQPSTRVDAYWLTSGMPQNGAVASMPRSGAVSSAGG